MKIVQINQIKELDGLGVVWAAASGIETRKDFTHMCKQASVRIKKTMGEIEKLKCSLKDVA